MIFFANQLHDFIYIIVVQFDTTIFGF